MTRRNHTIGPSRSVVLLPGLVCLAAFFFVGIVLGQVLSGLISEQTCGEIETYLSGYLRLQEEPFGAEGIFTGLWLYLRYPLAAFLLGFSAIGVLLLPFLSVAFGFFLSFSVCCFTAAFGLQGVFLAVGVMGIRCLATLPCYFWMASSAWRSAVSLARASQGRGRWSAVSAGGWRKAVWMVFFLCAAMILDLWVSPYFIRGLLEQIL